MGNVIGRIRAQKMPRLVEVTSPDRQFSEGENRAWHLPVPSTAPGISLAINQYRLKEKLMKRRKE